MKIEYLITNEDKEKFCCTEEGFRGLLMSNEAIKLEGDQLIIDSHALKFHLAKQQVRTEDHIFYISLETSKALDSLEKADGMIHRTIRHYERFSITTIWDDISIYYGKKLYPTINHIENQMRKLLYFFMVNALGKNWIKKGIPKEIKDQIAATEEENYLYKVSFSQLGKFFFSTFPKMELGNIIDKLKKLVQNKEEDKLSELISDFERKSNWERYFRDQVKDVDLKKDLEDDWDQLTEYRNRVAHCKEIHKADYKRAIDIARRVEDVLEKCLSQVGKLELSESDAAAIELDLGRSEFMTHISSMLDTTQTYPTEYFFMDEKQREEINRKRYECYYNALKS